MIVQVKTLEGRLFKVEAAPETNIKAVKDLIEGEPARAQGRDDEINS